jgi:hypothetical protein
LSGITHALLDESGIRSEFKECESVAPRHRFRFSFLPASLHREGAFDRTALKHADKLRITSGRYLSIPFRCLWMQKFASNPSLRRLFPEVSRDLELAQP